MSQGFVRSNAVTDVAMFIGDSGAVDSFGRLRVSSPSFVFDGQLTYDLAPLLYEQITTGSGATITHDSTNRCASIDFSASPFLSQAYMQTFDYFRYQPGRSQQIFLTFNFHGGVANVGKVVGYSDGANGIELQMNGTTAQFQIRSGTDNGNQTVAQTSWSLDKFDGAGPSGKTLDWTKVQILVIDFQALYVGRVRVGFDIDGVFYPAHQFVHANLIEYPYIQTANLPIRAGMLNGDAGAVSTTMDFICCSVASEGGSADAPAYYFSAEGTVTAGNGTQTHILSIRPITTFNGIGNRSKFALSSIEILAGNSPVKWELCIGQGISGTTTYTPANATYSGFEFNTAGTISGSPAMVVASGYVPSSAANRGSFSHEFAGRVPITLNAAGSARPLGTLSLILTGLGGTSACRAIFNWEEIR